MDEFNKICYNNQMPEPNHLGTLGQPNPSDATPRSYADLLPDGTLAERIMTLLQEAQSPDGRLRILRDGNVSERTKLLLLGESTQVRGRLLELFRSGHSAAPQESDDNLAEALLASESREILRPDPVRLRSWLISLLRQPHSADRRIRACMKEAFERGPDAFLLLLQAVAEIDMTTLSLQDAAEHGSVDGDVFLASLKLEDTIVRTAVELYQSASGDVSDRIAAAIPLAIPVPGIPRIDMSGASVPKTPPRIERYEKAVTLWLRQHIRDFPRLVDAFHTETGYTFGGKDTFLTKGTTHAFQVLVKAFIEEAGSTTAVLAATPGEYLPMLDAVRYHSFVAGSSRQTFTERDVVSTVRGFIKARLDSDTMPANLIVLVSSVPRRGGTRLDMVQLCAALRALEQEIGSDECPQIHIWVDASQDTPSDIPGADVQFYSKRGGTFVVIDQSRESAEESESQNALAKAAKMRSGFDTGQIARSVATIHGLRVGRQYGVRELLEQRHLWEREKDSVGKQVVDAERFLEASPVLAGRVRLVAPSPRSRGEAPHDMLLRLEPVERGGMDMAALEQLLVQRGVEVSSFSLRALPATDGETLSTLFERLNSEDVDAWDAEELIRSFQDRYSDRIAWSLLPDITMTTTKEQILRHLECAVEAHEFLRLYITESDPPHLLTDFLRHLECAVEALDRWHAADRQSSGRRPQPRQRRSRDSQ